MTRLAARPIVVRGTPLAQGRVPVVCVPLVGATRDALVAELGAVLPHRPDVIEWRVDHFAAVGDTNEVVAVGEELTARAGPAPLLFTCRREEEGGGATGLDADAAAAIYEAVFAAGVVDLADYEIGNGATGFARVREGAHAHGVTLIGSFHDFAGTPPTNAMVATFSEAKRLGADVATLAVMPKHPGDVAALLDATWQASEELAIPLISMAMGPLGIVSRIGGFVFGSSLTFGAGENASAPGQLTVDRLRAALDALR
jgi:3-dehydroquinate dehydratase-1